jgi:hypothetical protein
MCIVSRAKCEGCSTASITPFFFGIMVCLLQSTAYIISRPPQFNKLISPGTMRYQQLIETVFTVTRLRK